MDSKAIAEATVKTCLKKGADAAEVYIETGRNLSLEVRKGELETVQEAAGVGAGIRVFVGGKMAFASSNDLGEKALEDAVGRAIAFARITTADAANVLPDDKGLTEVAGLYDPGIAAIPMDRKIELARTVEKLATADPRITKTDGARYQESEGEVAIANSHRDIGRAQRFQGVHAGVPAMSRFGQEAHAVFVQQVPDRAEMVLDDQVADGLPVIVEEAPGDPGVQGRGIEQGGEIRDRVVAVPRAELVDKAVRPIDRLADLVAVEHEGLQRVEAFPPAQDPVEDMRHVDRGGLPAQVVDDQAVGVRARAFEGLPRVAGDEAHDPRNPLRGFP